MIFSISIIWLLFNMIRGGGLARVRRSDGGQYLLVSSVISGRKGIRAFLKEKNAQYRRSNGK